MPEIHFLSVRLRKFRRYKKMSQEDFAYASGVSTRTISQIEREKANPNLETLQKIAAFTGYTVPELLSPMH